MNTKALPIIIVHCLVLYSCSPDLHNLGMIGTHEDGKEEVDFWTRDINRGRYDQEVEGPYGLTRALEETRELGRIGGHARENIHVRIRALIDRYEHIFFDHADRETFHQEQVWSFKRVSALQLAAQQGDVELIEEILTRGQSRGITAHELVNARFARTDNQTPLQAALTGTSLMPGFRGDASAYPDRQMTMVTLLLQRGADLDAQDSEGRTALHTAIENGFTRAVEYLARVDAGGEARRLVRLNQPDNAGRTPLHLAANHYGHTLSFLLDNGGRESIDAVDNQGNTPLHITAYKGNSWGVTQLLNAGASAQIPNSAGELPIDMARKAEDEQFKVLEENPSMYGEQGRNRHQAYRNLKLLRGVTSALIASRR